MEEETDHYAVAHANMVQAMADLRKALAPIAAENNADLNATTELVLFKQRDPDRFAQIHEAAVQADQDVKATRSQLQQKMQELHEALQRENNATDADRLRAFSLLGHLRAHLDRMAES
jgi:hypothetical protein